MTFIQSKNRLYLMFAFVLESLFCVNIVLSNVFFTDILSLILLVSLLALIMLSQPTFIMRFPYICFLASSNLIGVLLVEHFELYLNELYATSFYKGSLPVLSFFWATFLLCLYSLEIIFPHAHYKSIELNVEFEVFNINFTVDRIVLITFVVGFLAIFVHVLPHPFFIEGLDRFTYAAKYFSNFEKKILGYLSYLLPVVICLAFDKKIKKYALFALSLYLVFKFWTGEKFGAFFSFFCFLSIIITAKMKFNLNSMKLKDFFGKFLVGIVLFLVVIFGHRTLLYGDSLQTYKNYLIQRIAQNGQLWWAMYEEPFSKENHTNELVDEYSSYYEGLDKTFYNSGIYKVMQKTTTQDRFWSTMSHKTRFSCSTFATLYYYLNLPGMTIFSIILAILFWILTRYFLFAIRNNMVLELIICSKLFAVSYSVLSQSDFYLLFSFQTFLGVALIIFFGIFRSLFAHLMNCTSGV
jgi:hypothetical protein